ncbi:response regulator, partial [bacterium]|nr:response regulator [bacterium]
DILTYQNYEVFKAFDGLDAYQKIKSQNYDLIILDIKLPKLDGFYLIEKLQKENINYPKIIITSACATDVDKQKAQALSISDYITKPIDINNFIKIVNSYFEN